MKALKLGNQEHAKPKTKHKKVVSDNVLPFHTNPYSTNDINNELRPMESPMTRQKCTFKRQEQCRSRNNTLSLSKTHTKTHKQRSIYYLYFLGRNKNKN